MGQAAYDYNTARRRKVPQTQRKTELRVEKGGKRRLSPLQAALRNAQLVSAQSQYTYYNSTLNSKTNITSVEEAASRLGLMKIDPSQITYIRLNESGALERQQSPVRQWTSFIYNGAVTILGTVK